MDGGRRNSGEKESRPKGNPNPKRGNIKKDIVRDWKDSLLGSVAGNRDQNGRNGGDGGGGSSASRRSTEAYGSG